MSIDYGLGAVRGECGLTVVRGECGLTVVRGACGLTAVGLAVVVHARQAPAAAASSA
ncbi:hypothetical protein SAMN05444920_11278 [Nonomuraea solani]|uniref:Uncharacterized protein n=1 Tax=Nonomuraea solani TaxID=1144553 RepID=A0A1H6ELW9_9ACTN|nr:hypothetical protein [Nonomuraea solani]SEG98858.1 hypothetical protein SAMN05444920_11278 [Nonomuraea solani]